MIGKVAGRIDYIAEDHALIDVKGIGYLVYCSERTLRSLPRAGEAVALYTDLLVREDNLQLFGFTSLVEKEWYRLLLTVQGVGAKASLAMLSALGPDGVSRAIALGDWGAVKAAKGIGPKTAQRVVMELKDKAPAIMALGAGPAPDMGQDDDVLEDIAPVSAPVAQVGGAAQSEALSALSNLGYAPSEAASAIAQAQENGGGEDTAALIRQALRLLAPKG
ncbi:MULTISPECIES: Holliday junction branch migration protein RuvA [Lentibacter]|jgi:holliday junction DNA helicase RuvA|uniref:Holliday junction branch migration complex subunit RuvA n=1 Tax=Lentibacter algarum TaxID=576131 RepID=A0A1H3HPL7_9RHOB|nr:Holliday junction branch migration protein RuvA [Lentibacter algarum]MCO4828223.1 Holliday junction branch migration protein RuvA [Lentibacter algarum]WIF31038.1 holliday junction ATP-dependent DNA helicase RuvA [Lentibacter algarum]SDY17350.1 Holliday junction DNA helicase subunit RuvA [Lentibacter algarum]